MTAHVHGERKNLLEYHRQKYSKPDKGVIACLQEVGTNFEKCIVGNYLIWEGGDNGIKFDLQTKNFNSLNAESHISLIYPRNSQSLPIKSITITAAWVNKLGYVRVCSYGSTGFLCRCPIGTHR